MPLSSRYLSVLAIPLIAVLAVSCAQSSSGSLTSPSGVPAASTTAGPSAGYDATGMWRFVSTFNGETETHDTFLTQLPNGDLQFPDEGVTVTLVRLTKGDAKIIAYRLDTVSDEGSECLLGEKATVLIDTETNTLTANIRLKELGCENQRGAVTVTATKL